MDLKLILGIVSGIFLIASMSFRDVKKIKYTILLYSCFDMGVSIYLQSWPLIGMYLLKIMIVSEYLLPCNPSRWIRRALPVAYAGVAIWAMYSFRNGFDWTNFVGWVHTGIALMAIAAISELRIKLLTMIACVIGFYYGFLIDFIPMSVIRVILFSVSGMGVYKILRDKEA